jgi:methanogenesis marker radical SAM protein
MEIFTDVGGRTGIDCGGYCEFCFYKNVDFNNLEPIGCMKCPPNQIGCNYCQNFINRVSTKFKSLSQVLEDIRTKFYENIMDSLVKNNFRIIVGGGADILSYPYLYDLISILKQSSLTLNLGYTSGKPIKDEHMPEKLISLGVDEVGFSVFSTNLEIRKRWMNDQNPDASINGLKMFCENIDLHASAVIIPRINDMDEIFETCIDLEKWGAKSLALRRFANFKNQGLILNNKPIIDGINPHSYEEFKVIVKKINNEFSFKVIGYPFYDPENDSPFTISKKDNQRYLKDLKRIESEATIITSKLAEPFLKKIFRIIDKANFVNLVSVDKEIADLITHEDLNSINLNKLKSKVIIPGGAFVHDNYSKKILTKDGKNRSIIRGPYILTYPYYEGVHLTNKDELIKFELESFNALIDTINS